MRRSLKLAALAAIASLAACATPPAPPMGPAPEGGYPISGQNAVRPTLNTVRVIDGSLARYVDRNYRVDSILDVENITLSPTGTGLSRISVELRNKSEFAIPLEVRNNWYDQSGRPVDTATSWTRLFAEPMSMVVYEQVAANPQASQYYVEVRGAQ